MRVPIKFVLLALYLLLIYLALTNHQFQEVTGLSRIENSLRSNIDGDTFTTSTVDILKKTFDLGTPESLKPFVGELLKVYESNLSTFTSNPSSIGRVNLTNITNSLNNLENPQQELNDVIDRVLEFFKQELYNQ